MNSILTVMADNQDDGPNKFSQQKLKVCCVCWLI
jgi:hypothetical protein